MDDSKRATRDHYDRISRTYNLIFDRFEQSYREAGARMLAVQSGESVLEIWYGTGRCLVEFAELVGDNGQVTGIDLSEGMKQVASERLVSRNLNDRVCLLVGDARELPFDDESFDAVFMSFVLAIFDDDQIPDVLDECLRVLKPGGRIGVVSLTSAEDPPVMERLYRLGHRLFPRLLDCRPINARNAIQSAGFNIKRARRWSMWGIPVNTILGVKVSPGA